MSSDRDPLAQRRVRLQQRSAVLREQLAADVQVLSPLLGTADRVRQAVQWVKANPLWVGAGVAGLVVLRPRRSLSVAVRAWSAWRFVQRVRSTLR